VRSFACIVLLVGCVAGALSGQTKSKSPVQPLRFEKLPELPQGAVDSFLTVKAEAKRVTVTMAFDNRCGTRPSGRYFLAADTLRVVIKHTVGRVGVAMCPGSQWFQAFAASTDTLRSGRYTVRIVVEHGGQRLPPRIYSGELEI
jgi:hypothetical protein